MAVGKLFLIPSPIAEGDPDKIFSAVWKSDISHIRHFIAEDVRSARRFLSSLKVFPAIEELAFSVLNVNTPEAQMSALIKPLKEGIDVGLLSEAGCPGVADPGAGVVALAHDAGIRVVPLIGPSSIILALMASGLNGQNFSFHGYLPVDQHDLTNAIKRLEAESKSKGTTQIFIESPHRNNRLLQTLKKTLSSSTRLCVALDLSGPDEKILSKRLDQWPELELPKKPCLFLFGC
ncbi:MAG: SAM-dependent methyltransferase [Bacteroidetes bacterium]|nr:SAM-dependent methyltransferase [Bacteroidota bacterium]